MERPKILPLRPSRLAVLAGAAVLAGVATYLVWQAAYGAGIAQAERALDQRLQLFARAVESEIEKYRSLAPVIARDARIREVLQAGDPAVPAANAYLEAVAADTGADDVYVLDRTGLTLAASNHAAPLSFVGHNYRFRPYFQDALASGQGRYYAVGVTTGKPGYFISSAIGGGESLLGVAVVKVDMAPLEASWAESNPLVAVADSDGVVFLAGRADWKYRTVAALQPEDLHRLGESRKYSGVDLAAAMPLFAEPARGTASATIVSGDLLFRTAPIVPEGWMLLAATDLSAIRAGASLAAVAAALLLLFSAAAAAILHQRRQLLRAKLESHDALERAVAERTAELAREVQERRRAEADLRAAQDSLVQAASLAALGRMSAAIAHEVSQPLAAIENTLATAGLYAGRGDMAETGRIVRKARALTERIQRTVRHLKTLARPDVSETRPVSLTKSVEAAIDIVAHRARDRSVEIVTDPLREPVFVSAHDIGVEQIVLNLLNNALDALEGTPDPVVRVRIAVAGDAATVTVSDNGPGIDDDVMLRITEPFFSTKQAGEGLGLGLSICRAIVEKFGGEMRAGRAAEGGAEFVVSLPLAGTGRLRRGNAA
jgi:two-component system, NtrC family, C4-dicarboxylate transport sensor histidine kinase DctB